MNGFSLRFWFEWCGFDLIVNEVDHLFMCWLAICISSLKKRLFKSLFHFKIALFLPWLGGPLGWRVVPYTKKLWVRFLVWALSKVTGMIPSRDTYRRQLIDTSLSCWCFSLSLSPAPPPPSLSHTLSVSLKSIKKNPQVRIKKKCIVFSLFNFKSILSTSTLSNKWFVNIVSCRLPSYLIDSILWSTKVFNFESPSYLFS